MSNKEEVFGALSRVPQTPREIEKKISVSYDLIHRNLRELLKEGRAKKGKKRKCKITGHSQSTFYTENQKHPKSFLDLF